MTQVPDHTKLPTPNEIAIAYAVDLAYKAGVEDGINQGSDETAAMYDEPEWYRKGKADASAKAIEAAEGLVRLAKRVQHISGDWNDALSAWNKWAEGDRDHLPNDRS